MASLLSSIPPSTDCSAATSCGGVRSAWGRRAPDRSAGNSATLTGPPPPSPRGDMPPHRAHTYRSPPTKAGSAPLVALGSAPALEAASTHGSASGKTLWAPTGRLNGACARGSGDGVDGQRGQLCTGCG